MPEPARLRCENCGHTFVEPVLTDAEKEQLRRQKRGWSAMTCEKCGSDRLARF